MKTYIINLEKSEKRRKHIVGEAEKCGLEYEVVKAVEGAKLSPEDLDELCDMDKVREFPEWLSPGMIGASLSHRKVYNKIIENGEEMALVLEDDAILPVFLPQILDDISAQVKQNEVVLIYYSSFTTLGFSTCNSVPLANKTRLMYPMFLQGVGGGVCYVVTQDAAKSLYDGLLPIAYSPDSWRDFIEAGFLKSLRCVYPVVADHLGVKSTIDATNQGFLRREITELIDKYEVPFLQKKLQSMRRSSLLSRSNYSLTDDRSPLDVD